MDFYYITDDNHNLDEATFWTYLRFKVYEVYCDVGMEGIKPLYSIDY